MPRSNARRRIARCVSMRLVVAEVVPQAERDRRAAGCRCGRSGGRASRRSGPRRRHRSCPHPTKGASFDAGRPWRGMRRTPQTSDRWPRGASGRRRRRGAALAAGLVGRMRSSDALWSGRLHVRHRGVYAVGHEAIGARAAAGPRCSRCATAMTRLRGGGVGIATAPAVIHVTVRGRAGLRSRDGIRVHRPRALPDDEVTALRGLPITTPARTLLDLAATARSAAIAVAVDRAEQLRLLDFAELHSLLTRYPGRAGTPFPQSGVGRVRRPGRRPQPPRAARAPPVRAASAAGTAGQRRHRRQRPRLRLAAAAARRRGGLVPPGTGRRRR